MAKIHGRLSTISWNATSVSGLETIAMALDRPEIDTTTHDDGDSRSFISGRLAATISISGKWDEADAGQSAMQADIVSGTDRALVFRMQTAGGAHEFTGTGKITSWEPAGPNDAAGTISAKIRINGALTEATQ